jgi:hypothetical protein
LTLALTFTLALSPSPTPSLAKQQHQLPTLTPTPNSTPIPAQPSPSPHPTRLQVGGLCALLTHASLTPYLSGVPWRHRAAQGLSALTAASSLAYGAHALPTTLPTTLPTLPTTRLATPPPPPARPNRPTALRSPEAQSSHPDPKAAPRPEPPLLLPLRNAGRALRLRRPRAPRIGFRRHRMRPRRRQRHGAPSPHRRRAGAPLYLCASAPPCTPLHPLAPLAPLPLCRWRCSRVPSPRRP